MKRLALIATLALGACTSAPQSAPVATTQICPPNPPAGSGYICAPSKACSLSPDVLKLDQGPLGAVLPTKYRNAIGHFAQGVEDLCSP